MENLIDTLADLANRAGEITLKYFQTGIKVEKKADASPVTVADRETEEFLRAEIARLFPADAVMGEEFGETAGSGGQRRWILDPIDGTRTFVHGVPLYGVMIGVEENGEMVAGAVNIPAAGDLVVAQKGLGCWWNGRPARVSGVARLEDALLLTTDVANNHKYGKGGVWERLSSRARLVRTWGDCYGHVLVATGRADVMVDPIMSPWDGAALKPIVEEAGGVFTDYEGRATIYSECAVVTNGQLHDEVMELVRRPE